MHMIRGMPGGETRRRIDEQGPDAVAWAENVRGIVEGALGRDVDVTSHADPQVNIKAFQQAIKELRNCQPSMVKMASLALRLVLYWSLYKKDNHAWSGAMVQMLHEFEKEVKRI